MDKIAVVKRIRFRNSETGASDRCGNVKTFSKTASKGGFASANVAD